MAGQSAKQGSPSLDERARNSHVALQSCFATPVLVEETMVETDLCFLRVRTRVDYLEEVTVEFNRLGAVPVGLADGSPTLVQSEALKHAARADSLQGRNYGSH